MQNNLTTINKDQLYPYTVGFDNIFDRLFESDFTSTGNNFPPYNIIKDDEYKYTIEMALAGYSKKDIEIELKEGTLYVSSKKQENFNDSEKSLIHKGISHRSFSRSFTLSDEMEVSGAEMKDGMLNITLKRVIPDHKKPQIISIK